MAEKTSGFNSADRRQNMNGALGRKDTHDMCLAAIKEDLASWFTRLLGAEVTVETFMSRLDTGVVLCQLANLIQSTGEEYMLSHPEIRETSFPRVSTTYKERTAFRGSFIARDNVANFIRWCRDLGVPESIMFESDDLVLQKNEKCVLLTLLEVARRSAKFGVEPPDLIQMENEIDQEIDQEEPEAMPESQQQQEQIEMTTRKLTRNKSHSLDDLVSASVEMWIFID